MDYWKIAGVVLSLAGTIVLAVRVTKLLSCISMAVKAHDLNFQIKAARASGRRDIPGVQIHGASAHINIAEKLGLKLLVVGFLLQIAGGACTIASIIR